MSKASEWARLNEQMKIMIGDRQEARAGGAGVVLSHFGADGNISQQISYTSDEALKLAHWILDTFAQPAAGAPKAE